MPHHMSWTCTKDHPKVSFYDIGVFFNLIKNIVTIFRNAAVCDIWAIFCFERKEIKKLKTACDFF